MTLDMTVNLGTVIAGLTLCGTVISCYISLVRQIAEVRGKITELRTMVLPLWEQFKDDRR